MDRSYFDLDLSDWNWDPDKKASFHRPLAHFERSPKLSDEEFIEYCMAPLLEDDTWKQIDLVTEIDFDDIQGLSRRGETTLFFGKSDAYRPLAPDDTDVLLPLEAIVEMYREQVMSDRYLPTEEELGNRSHRDSYLDVFGEDEAWSATPEHKPRWEEGTFYLLVEERWSSAGLVDPDPHAVGFVFQSKYAKWILESDSNGPGPGWKRLGGLEYNGLHSDYSCHVVTNRLECLYLLSESRSFKEYAPHVRFHQKGLTKAAWELVTTGLSLESKHSEDWRSADTSGSLNVRQLAEKTFDVKLPNLSARFEETGWRYQGRTDIGCVDCGHEDYEVFRKPYTTAQGNYEYWGIVCIHCLSCTGLDVFDQPARKLFRDWSKSTSSRVSFETEAPEGKTQNHSDMSHTEKGYRIGSSQQTPDARESHEEVLPLPGDPGATRRPGKRRERYRTGEEAELRHIARQHKWWE